MTAFASGLNDLLTGLNSSTPEKTKNKLIGDHKASALFVDLQRKMTQ